MKNTIKHTTGFRVIGIDNGVTGAIAILGEKGEILWLYQTPTRKTLSYQASRVSHITRIDVAHFTETLRHCYLQMKSDDIRFLIGIERPMVTPARWHASLSAIRALEATELTFELFAKAHSRVRYVLKFTNAKEWRDKLQEYHSVSSWPELHTILKTEIFQRYPVMAKHHNEAKMNALIDAYGIAKWTYLFQRHLLPRSSIYTKIIKQKPRQIHKPKPKLSASHGEAPAGPKEPNAF